MINLTVMMLVGTISVCYVFDRTYSYYNTFYPILLTLIFTILFAAVLNMRATMLSIAYAFPNERLMCIHFINFPVWIILIIAETVLGVISLNMDSKMSTATPEQELKHVKILYSSLMFSNIQIPFNLWLGLWLLFLILKSTSSDDLSRYGIKDLILGHKVPPIVFIKNRSLLRQIVTSELENDSVLR